MGECDSPIQFGANSMRGEFGMGEFNSPIQFGANAMRGEFNSPLQCGIRNHWNDFYGFFKLIKWQF